MTSSRRHFGYEFGFQPAVIRRIQLNAAGAVASPGGDGGGGGGSSAAAAPPAVGSQPAAAGSNSSGAQPGGTPAANGANGSGTPPGQGAGNGNADNIAILRTSHETLSRLGGADKVSAAVQQYTKIHSTASQLAEQLGYTPESFESSFAEDPIAIHNHLINEARQVAAQRGQDRNGNGQGQGNGNQGQGPDINRELAPIRNFIQNQMADKANTAVDTEFNSQLSAHSLFKGKQVPPEIRNAIYDNFTELVKGDNAAQMKVLKSGDVSGLKVHFDSAVANMIKFAQSYGSWASGGNGQGGNGGQGNGNGQGAQGQGQGQGQNTSDPYKNLTLDDIISGDDKANVMPSMRNFR
jgi:hypothetical protein